jgi:hypothetical protein
MCGEHTKFGNPGAKAVKPAQYYTNPHVSQAKIACETYAFAAILCGKSFGAVLAHLAQDSPSTRRKANPEQAPVSGRVEAF